MSHSALLYTVGGTVHVDSPALYIRRQADKQLMALCRASTFGYVLTARQLGKSSLMVQTAYTLAKEGYRCASVDLTLLDTHDILASEWYLSLLEILEKELKLNTDTFEWWEDHGHLGVSYRFIKFFKEVVVTEVRTSVVIFFDEIDSTLKLPFSDDFFAAIRALYNARAQEPELKRLTFVLIGLATPSDLITDSKRTPFNIGERIELTDFTRQEAAPLAKGLNVSSDWAPNVLNQVLKWTNGHPYLTQRLCETLANHPDPIRSLLEVNQIVALTLLGEAGMKDSNLQFVDRMLTQSGFDQLAVLATYRDIRTGWISIRHDKHSRIHTHLKLSGIVRQQGKTLQVRNRIYKEVFNKQWIKEQWPLNWWETLSLAAKVSIFSIIFMIIALFVASFMVIQNQKIETAYATAEAERSIAQEARATAEAERFSAEAARSTAEVAKEETGHALATVQVAIAQKSQAHATAVAARSTAEAAKEQESQARATAVAALLTAEAAKEEALVEAYTNADKALIAQSELLVNKIESNYAHNPDLALLSVLKANRMNVKNKSPEVSKALNWIVEETEALRDVLPPSSDGIQWVEWSPDGKQVLIGGDNDQNFYIWDKATNKLDDFPEYKGRIWQVEWNQDQLRVLIIDESGQISIINHEDRKILHSTSLLGSKEIEPKQLNRLRNPTFRARIEEAVTDQLFASEDFLTSIQSIRWSPNQRNVLIYYQNETIKIWNVSSEKFHEINNNKLLSNNLWVQWHPNRQELLIGRDNGEVLTFDWHIEEVTFLLKGFDGAIRSVAWSRNGESVVIGRDDGNSQIWDRISNEVITLKENSTAPIRAIAWHPDGQEVITGDEEGKIRIWHRNGSLLKSMSAHSAAITAVQWHPDGQEVITGSEDGTVRIWDGTIYQRINRRRFLTASSNREIKIRVADDSLLMAKLIESVCKVWGHDELAIESEIEEWRGCGTELALVADKIERYNTLRGLE